MNHSMESITYVLLLQLMTSVLPLDYVENTTIMMSTILFPRIKQNLRQRRRSLQNSGSKYQSDGNKNDTSAFTEIFIYNKRQT